MINPFKAIQALFLTKSTVTEIIQEGKQMNGVTPGWKTSEFWGKVAVQVMTLWTAVQGFVPVKYAAIVTIGLEALYNVGRIVVKAVAGIQEARAGSVSSVTPPVTATATVTAS